MDWRDLDELSRRRFGVLGTIFCVATLLSFFDCLVESRLSALAGGGSLEVFAAESNTKTFGYSALQQAALAFDAENKSGVVPDPVPVYAWELSRLARELDALDGPIEPWQLAVGRLRSLVAPADRPWLMESVGAAAVDPSLAIAAAELRAALPLDRADASRLEQHLAWILRDPGFSLAIRQAVVRPVVRHTASDESVLRLTERSLFGPDPMQGRHLWSAALATRATPRFTTAMVRWAQQEPEALDLTLETLRQMRATTGGLLEESTARALAAWPTPHSAVLRLHAEIDPVGAWLRAAEFHRSGQHPEFRFEAWVASLDLDSDVADTIANWAATQAPDRGEVLAAWGLFARGDAKDPNTERAREELVACLEQSSDEALLRRALTSVAGIASTSVDDALCDLLEHSRDPGVRIAAARALRDAVPTERNRQALASIARNQNLGSLARHAQLALE